MLLNTLILTEAITKDGGVSADWTLVIVIGICGALISLIFGLLLNSINSIKDELKDIKESFHAFVVEQTKLNSTLIEKTKDL